MTSITAADDTNYYLFTTIRRRPYCLSMLICVQRILVLSWSTLLVVQAPQKLSIYSFCCIFIRMLSRCRCALYVRVWIRCFGAKLILSPPTTTNVSYANILDRVTRRLIRIQAVWHSDTVFTNFKRHWNTLKIEAENTFCRRQFMAD